MKRTLLVINTGSGSADAIGQDEIARHLTDAGYDIRKIVILPARDLPTRAEVEAGGIDLVTILSGDGTVSSLCKKLSGWDGTILPLPGGTMNLLCRKLHGDVQISELLAALVRAQMISGPVPVVRAAGFEILTGLIAGPSSEWGKVREGLRERNVASLLQEVPGAWNDTIKGQSMRLLGREDRYPAIFVEPVSSEVLSVIAFRADGIGDMLGHGIAWLRRDFREGPHDYLGQMSEVTIIDDDLEIGLLVDGEQQVAKSPLICQAGMSSVNFMRYK